MSDYIPFSSRARAPYNILSNFYESSEPITIYVPFREERTFPTVEHFYVYYKIKFFCKTEKEEVRTRLYKQLFSSTSGSKAKSIGKQIPANLLSHRQIHEQWNAMKGPLMLIAIFYKAKNLREFRLTLLSTGSLKIHETVGSPNFWNWPGSDTMGQHLMAVRTSLQSATLQKDLSECIHAFEEEFHVSRKTKKNRRLNRRRRQNQS